MPQGVRLKGGEINVPCCPKKTLNKPSQPRVSMKPRAGSHKAMEKQRQPVTRAEGDFGASCHHWQDSSMVIGSWNYKMPTGFI